MKLNLRFNKNGINKKWNIIRLPYRSLIFHRNCSHSCNVSIYSGTIINKSPLFVRELLQWYQTIEY